MTLPWYLEDPTSEWYKPKNWGDCWEPQCLDLETTNLDKGDSRHPDNRIVLAAMSSGGRPAELIDTSLTGMLPASLLIAHNAKFELGWMLRLGMDISQYLVWDTMIAEYVLAGNRRWELGLDATCRRYGLRAKDPVIDSLMRGGVCPSQMPRKRLEERVLRDVETTYQLYRLQYERLKKDGLLPVMFTRCIFTPVLAHIEREGLHLDGPRVLEETARCRARRSELEAALLAQTQGAKLKGKSFAKFLYETLGFEELRDRRGNPKRTASGLPATDADTLDSLVAKTSEQKAFVAARKDFGKVDAALTKSLVFFEAAVKQQGGHFFGNFNQTRTKTHRLSSTGKPITLAGRGARSASVQFQNLPNEFKPLLVAGDPDYLVVEADGSGLEFRVAADLAHDGQALADILDPAWDPHTATAAIISGRDNAQVTKGQRRDAKKHTFKPLFSTGKSGTKREQAYYQWFKERYGAITALQDKWISTALSEGTVRLASGLRSYWTLRVSRTGYIEGANELRNLPIQSFATADIIPVSVVYTFWRSEGLRRKVVNTVHDSAVATVHKEDVDAYRKVVIQAFLKDTYRYLDRVYHHKMWVPLGVGFTVGPRWSEGVEEKYSEVYDG